MPSLVTSSGSQQSVSGSSRSPLHIFCLVLVTLVTATYLAWRPFNSPTPSFDIHAAIDIHHVQPGLSNTHHTHSTGPFDWPLTQEYQSCILRESPLLHQQEEDEDSVMASPVSAPMRVLYVTAHPDDEAMFFVPSITSMTSTDACEVHLLCLSTGNYDGLGDIRKAELMSCGAVLGIREEHIAILDHRDLQDGPHGWNVDVVSQVVEDYVVSIDANVIVTFDSGGVSGHPNHISTHEGVKNLHKTRQQQQQQQQHRAPSPLAVYTLHTSSLLRKYSGLLDVFTTHFIQHYLSSSPQSSSSSSSPSSASSSSSSSSSSLRSPLNTSTSYTAKSHSIGNDASDRESSSSSPLLTRDQIPPELIPIYQYLLSSSSPSSSSSPPPPPPPPPALFFTTFSMDNAYRAMQAHASQFVWFRRLFILFSAYPYTNTLTPLDETCEGRRP